MALNLEYFKKKLEEEKARLESELNRVGKRNPQVPGDWEPIPGDSDRDTRISEQSELADSFEEFANRSAVEVHLEERLNEIIAALKRIENGTYGACTACGEQIDESRLEANPSSATCVKHSRV